MSLKDRFRVAASVANVKSQNIMLPPNSKPYAMSRPDDDNAEMVLYGEIVEERPQDWWTDKEIEGQYIVLKEVLDDLKTLSGVKNLTVRIHSCGGDAGVAIVIHNKLKEMNAHVTVIVDGVAMSGGSLIMCAADTVRVFPGSIVMIHKCWSFFFGGYNAAELKTRANGMDAIDRAQAAIYVERTGKTEEEILQLMADETHMTGEDAIELGFADELVKSGTGATIAASADRKTLFVSGMPVWVSDKALPDKFKNIPTISAGVPVKESAQGTTETTGPDTGEGGNETMAKTVEELRQECPALCKQLVDETNAKSSDELNAAVKAERERIKDIDSIAPNIMDVELVESAKFGEKPMTAQELAFKALKTQTSQGNSYLADQQEDAQASGVANVEGAQVPDQEGESPEDVKAQAKADVEKFMPRKETN